ncbi:hypothetical protein G6F63_014229 [Rhizopus arrhizus]|nr:hypothetical protein G6F63_014229 [Rhizopus arrhizus]
MRWASRGVLGLGCGADGPQRGGGCQRQGGGPPTPACKGDVGGIAHACLLSCVSWRERAGAGPHWGRLLIQPQSRPRWHTGPAPSMAWAAKQIARNGKGGARAVPRAPDALHGQADPGGLQVRVLVQRVQGLVAAEARLLDAAEGHRDVAVGVAPAPRP